MSKMMYFHLATYFLVVILIRDGIAQNEYGSIWSNTSIVSPGDSYTISCKSEHTFWFRKNTSTHPYIANERCRSSLVEYDCEHEKRENFYYATLTIKCESSPTNVKWSCLFRNDRKSFRSEPLYIEVRRDDSSSSSSSPKTCINPLVADNSPSPSSPNDQPPFSITNSVNQQSIYFTIMPIAVCAVGVLVLFNTVLVLMFLYKRRKRDLAKQESRPLELVRRRSPAEDTYNNLDRTSDDGHMYATAQPEGIAVIGDPSYTNQ